MLKLELEIRAAFELENQTCLTALVVGWCHGAQVQKRALQAKCAKGRAEIAGL